MLPPAGSFTGTGTPYGLAALQGLLDELRTAPIGTRNNTLYRAACRTHELIQAGHLTQLALRHLSQAATEAGLGTTEIDRTLESADSCKHEGRGVAFVFRNTR